ncbi:GAF and ANTAR domain-containing protein [Actinoplanes sp. NEAU-A12]|uniref:GAF and ANTAR domain-containing protein n=1 Tax=Actinoplanes sandaracinus TaxID=3045177 RepID=A0ABT6WNP0_9ACTN|nr:GAF and ANTAR domain-containing protein [Actinoplanes sandaracinus]MDI6101387.1 GAF and ANTAR domain-containing protein [Actinoplanes sandaracinus]
MNATQTASSGDRDQLIARAFVELAAAAGEGGHAVDVAHTLARWSLRLLDVSGAGVMLPDQRGVLTSMAVSSEAVRALEHEELAAGRGPCVESHRQARELVFADVDIADERWPGFGPSARAGGIRAVHAFPMLAGEKAVGVLNLFRPSTGGLAGPDSHLARSMAAAAGDTVCRLRRQARAEIRMGELTTALAEAASVERAKGMLAVRLHLDPDTVSAVLRHTARARRLRVGQLAEAVLAGTGTVDFPLVVDPPDADDGS